MPDMQHKDQSKTRRRGQELEAAILQAVRDELYENGYAQLSMERVAERSGTSKAVLYRRWSNRAELVLAAISERIPLPVEQIPDRGSLRDDVCDIVRAMNRNTTEMIAKAWHGLITELGSVSLASILFPQGRQNRSMATVMQRAVERGEISASAVTPRLLTLPLDLARHELILYQKPLTEETIAEIVDEVFLPLVQRL